MFMRIAFTALALVTIAGAGPISTMTYSGSPCVTSEAGYQTGIAAAGYDAVVATALADYIPPGIGSLPASSCAVTESDYLIVNGSGTGFLTFSLSGDAEADPSFYINGTYEGGCGFGCIPSSGTIPITLGTPFEISVVADAFYSPVGCCYSASLIQATIQVYQLVDGCPDSSYGPCNFQEDQAISDFVAPEPDARWLALFGLGAIAMFFRLRSPRSSS
jgi:hypothetical protein